MTLEASGHGGWVSRSTLGAAMMGALVLTVSPEVGAQTEGAADSPPAVEGPAAAEPTEESAALADDSGPAAEPAPAAAPAESAPPSDANTDGARFRFGVSGGFGPLFIPLTGLPTQWYSGLDLRLGVQLNDLIGIYVQPQLGGYWDLGGGIAGASAVVDFTFIDRIFVGAGLGYAVVNNPSGLELQLRAGGYPLMKKYDDRARRKGLSVALDFRIHFLDGLDPSVAPTVSVGYEAF